MQIVGRGFDKQISGANIAIFFLGMLGASGILAENQVACRYYDKSASSQNTSFLHPGLPWLWARGEENENIYVSGKKVDGFFEVEGMAGRSKGFFRSTTIPYNNSLETAQELCSLALKRAFPEEYQQKTVLDIVIKSSYLSLSSLPLVFPKNDNKQIKDIDRMVIFGDSLSDQGNLRNWLRVFPAEPYFAGRFSNGPVWIDYFKEISGVAVQNWAVGGSVSIPHYDPEFDKHSFTEGTVLSASLAISGTVQKELNKFVKNSLENKPIVQAASTLFVIWIGGNDYLTWLSSVKDADIFIDEPEHERAGSNIIIRRVTNSIVEHMEKLYAVGARQFLVMNLPNLGTTPRMLENETYHLNKNEAANKRLVSLSEGLTRITQVHNHLLKQNVDAFANGHEDVKTTFIDAFNGLENSLASLKRSAVTSFSNYGIDFDFVNTIQYDNRTSIINRACYYGGIFGSKAGTTCVSPNQKLFWDNIHPSSYSHCLIAMNIHKNLADQAVFFEPDMREYLRRCRPEIL
jgi:thermolabile hemolysin